MPEGEGRRAGVSMRSREKQKGQEETSNRPGLSIRDLLYRPHEAIIPRGGEREGVRKGNGKRG